MERYYQSFRYSLEHVRAKRRFVCVRTNGCRRRAGLLAGRTLGCSRHRVPRSRVGLRKRGTLGHGGKQCVGLWGRHARSSRRGKVVEQVARGCRISTLESSGVGPRGGDGRELCFHINSYLAKHDLYPLSWTPRFVGYQV